MGTVQSSLTDISDDNSTAPVEIPLERELSELGINTTATNVLTDHYDSKSEITNSTDLKLLGLDSIGKKTVATIRQEWDDSVGDDYTITDSGPGHVESEWTEKADIIADIIAGGLITQALTDDHYDSLSDLLNDLDTWADNYDQASTVADALIEATKDISHSDLTNTTLFDIDPFEAKITDESKLADDKREALFKSRALMAFCNFTDKRSVYISAYSKAESIVSEARHRLKEEKEKQRRAKQFLQYPDKEVGNWKRINYGLHDIDSVIMAYRGKYNGVPSVLCLFETEKFIKIQGFRLADWMAADQNPIEADMHFSTGKTPTRKAQAAMQTKEWLEEHPCDEPLPTSEIDYNGWYVIEDDPETELISYADPVQNAEITVEGTSITLKANGEKQTSEAISHHQAKQDLIDYLYATPGISEGGDPIEIPYPDSEPLESPPS